MQLVHRFNANLEYGSHIYLIIASQRSHNLDSLTHMGKNQHSFPPEKKAQLLIEIAELKYLGETYGGVATKLKISHQTVVKYWKEILQATLPPDPAELVIEYRGITRRIAEKAIQDFHKGKAFAKDAIAAIQFANDFNGVNTYLDSATPERPPNLLQLEITQVPFELPPSREQSINQSTEPQE